MIFLLFQSCNENEHIVPENFDFTGFWVNEQLDDSVLTYIRADALAENQYCFGFTNDGRFLERKNSGGCATPPIVYADYEGSWSEEDSVISITVPFWGGTAFYKWKVVELEKNRLSLIRVETDHEFEAW